MSKCSHFSLVSKRKVEENLRQYCSDIRGNREMGTRKVKTLFQNCRIVHVVPNEIIQTNNILIWVNHVLSWSGVDLKNSKRYKLWIWKFWLFTDYLKFRDTNCNQNYENRTQTCKTENNRMTPKTQSPNLQPQCTFRNHLNLKY